MKPLLVVDAANVVGSVPDGWWRDRAGAAERLRDALRGRDEEVVLVVEGKARNVSSVDDVQVVSAERSGDDKIVEVVQSMGAGRPVTVVTADRELRRRVMALGAEVAGPTSVPRR